MLNYRISCLRHFARSAGSASAASSRMGYLDAYNKQNPRAYEFDINRKYI